MSSPPRSLSAVMAFVAVTVLTALFAGTALGQSGPSMTLTKTLVPDAPIVEGGNAVFEITLENDGSENLAFVTVADPLCTGGLVEVSKGNGDAVLDQGETWEYSCTVEGPTNDFTNTVTALAARQNGQSVFAEASADVTVLSKGIDIEKSADRTVVLFGETVNFTLAVNNTGDTPLSAVEVTDPTCSAQPLALVSGDNGNGILDPDETWIYECSFGPVADDFTNVAYVTARAGAETLDDADYLDIEVVNPNIEVEKLPALQYALPGDDVAFTLLVENTGVNPLTQVRLQDDRCTTLTEVSKGNGDDTLDVGETWEYLCTLEDVTQDVLNTAVVTAEANGVPVQDDETARVDVIQPQLEVNKSPSSQEIREGARAVFNITATNTADDGSKLLNVALEDPKCTIIRGPQKQNGNTDNVLDPGETWEWRCIVENVDEDFVNTATVTADDQAGNQLFRQASATVNVLSPFIDIEKTPATLTIRQGDAAPFTLIVRNTGEATLRSIVVQDDLCTPPIQRIDDGDGVNGLSPGEIWVYQCSVTNVARSFQNWASVSATDGQNDVDDRDWADVKVINPGIDLDKLPTYQAVYAGGAAYFTFEVRNTGDEDLRNVVLTDGLCATPPTFDPASDDGDGLLNPGEVWTTSCIVENVVKDETNSATVTANEVSSDWEVSDTETAEIDVINPGLNVDKRPNSQTVLEGSDAVFRIRVTNTGDDGDLTVTDVSDPLCDVGPVYRSGDDNNDGKVNPGEVWIYRCVVRGVLQDFSNFVSVTAQDAAGGEYIAEDSALVDVLSPGIDIEKTPSEQTVRRGDRVFFTLYVTNTGDQVLSNVTVSDSECGVPRQIDNGDGDAVMQPGEVWIYRCAVRAVDDFLNTATVTAVDESQATVRDDDSASVRVINPDINLEKLPVFQAVRQGDDARFTLYVSNLGDQDLTDVTVNDVFCDVGQTPEAGDSNNDNVLNPGEVWQFVCIATNVQVDFINTATAAAMDPLGLPVDDSDSAEVDVIKPDLNVSKLARPDVVFIGEDALFYIVVENPLNDADGNPDPDRPPLTNVSVEDELCDIGPTRILPDRPGNDDDLLEPGENWVFECIIQNLVDDVTNTATVEATDPSGNVLTEQGEATVRVRQLKIDITKEPFERTVFQGADDVSWILYVRNFGETDLDTVEVRDPLCQGWNRKTQPDRGDNGNGILERGEVWEYDCDYPGAAEENILNQASVTAEDPNDNPTSDDAVAYVEVINPDIELEKIAQPPVVRQGEDVLFTILVYNTGDQDLSDITLVDEACDAEPVLVGGDENGDSILNPDEIWEYECTVTNLDEDLVNYAKVTAFDERNNEVTDEETVLVDVINPVIDLEKRPELRVILRGENARFRLRVSNTGDAPLSEVQITDEACRQPIERLADNPGNNDDRLDPDETWIFRCVIPDVQADLTNFAEVTAKDPAGQSVSDSDSAEVDVLSPDILLEKSPPFQRIRLGEHASWTLRVRNPGETDLFNISLVDHWCNPVYVRGDGDPAFNIPPDDVLQPGEVWVYSCTTQGFLGGLHPLDDFFNYAAVTANDGNGNGVADDERAEVDVVNPGIDLEKRPGSQLVAIGANVEFRFRVRNMGDQDLYRVKVEDNQCDDGPFLESGDRNSDDILQVDEVWVYRCLVTNVQDDFENRAEVTAFDSSDFEVSDTDTATVNVVNAGINIEKDTITPVVPKGTDVTFTLRVEPTGAEVVSNLQLIDELCDEIAGPDGDDGDGILEVDEVWQYTCVVKNVQDDFTNTAKIVGEEVLSGLQLSDTDSADVDVINPNIDLEKRAVQNTIKQGDDAEFTLEVTNTSSEDLSGVIVSDAQCDSGPTRVDGDENNDSILQPDEVWTYVCIIYNVQRDLTNSASVSAANNGQVVTDVDSATVEVINPLIDVTKTADQPVAAAGANVTFTILVENTGDQNLTGVQISDPYCYVAPGYVGGDNGDLVLNPTEVWRFTCTVVDVKEDFTNTAVATAMLGNERVSASGSAAVDVVNPQIDLEKRAVVQTVVQGEDAGFLLTVRNTGTSVLSSVSVIDDRCDVGPDLLDDGDGDSLLSPGESWIYTCVVEALEDDLVNVATVTAQLGANTVTDSDSAAVQVVSNAVDISIGTNTDVVITGANVEILTTVRNRTSTDLQILSVTIDPCPTTPTYVSGDANGDGWLNPDESWNYRCRIENVQSGFTVTATVQAQDRDGNAVSDTDSLDITDIELPDLEKLYLPLVWQRWP